VAPGLQRGMERDGPAFAYVVQGQPLNFQLERLFAALAGHEFKYHTVSLDLVYPHGIFRITVGQWHHAVRFSVGTLRRNQHVQSNHLNMADAFLNAE
jgi:hypothetical protein